MYTINRHGPWPIIDPTQTLQSFATSATAASGSTTALGSDLCVHLDTPNLGSQTEGFRNAVWTGTASATGAAVGDHTTFGICLAPLGNITTLGDPTYIDISMAMAGPFSSQNTIFQPYVGFIDDPDAVLAAGWDATHNLVSNACIIADGWGAQVYDYTYQLNTQVLLKDIVSGGLDTDKFLSIGFSMIRTSTASFTGCRFTIHGRYADQAINTSYKGI